MDIKDVKVGMKVVPHSKHGASTYEELMDYPYFGSAMKKQGYLIVNALWYAPDNWSLWPENHTARHCSGFRASDFEPYIDPQIKQKFGGYTQGNKTVVYFGSEKGEANYNPNDAKQGLPYNKAYGIALAACRAEDIDTAWLDNAIEANKPTAHSVTVDGVNYVKEEL
jgi:hypothetical protein